ncbi:unnamed protein product, partial [Ixodes persulcatus]
VQRQRLCVDKGRNETVAYAKVRGSCYNRAPQLSYFKKSFWKDHVCGETLTKVVEFENFCIYYCVARGNDGWAYGYYHDWTECKGGFCKNGWCNRPRLCKT